ncbi:right-handed parallel beta-helix repeat-containing protein [Candidatus Omnitrophota bacterium]
MKDLIILVLSVISATSSFSADIQVPEKYKSIQQAVEAAKNGDTIHIGPGTYTGEIIIDRPLTLEGLNRTSCLLTGGDGEGTVVTINSNVRMSGLTVGGAENGIVLNPGSVLEIDDCMIMDNKSDGIGFDNSFETVLTMNRCIITGNGDGIDLESTQGVILNSIFVKNRDDGLDYDGDAGVLVSNCTFADNGDDGIEIRLSRVSQAIILNSTFQRNGEDGIEIINSPIEDGNYNILSVQNSDFKGNKRYGVGFVEQKSEKHTGEMSKTAVYAAGNLFSSSGEGAVSPNYLSVFEAVSAYPRMVKMTVDNGNTTEQYDVPIKLPVLVGIYNLRPTTDGTMLSDAEGVTVSGERVFVADDNSRAVFMLDRKTGRIVKTIPTAPFPASDKEAPGPEGMDVVRENGKDRLLLADDDGVSLYELSLSESTFGRILRHRETTAIGKAEGVERIGDRLIFTAGQNKIFDVSSDDLSHVTAVRTIKCKELGHHIAGVGVDESGSRVFLTLSGYNSAKHIRNHKGGFFDMDWSSGKIQTLWHLGPFSNDPRGISVADGLVYVVDGRSDFEDTETGEMNRGGIKVSVFMLEDDAKVLEGKLDVLPVRSRK